MPDVKALLTDPLAGCLPEIFESKGSRVVMDTLLLRLSLRYGRKHSWWVVDQILKQGVKTPIPFWQFCVNEGLYETRRGLFTPEFERVVLDNWIRRLVPSLGVDGALDSRLYISACREDRFPF